MSDLGLLNVYQDEMMVQMEEIVQTEIKRAEKKYIEEKEKQISFNKMKKKEANNNNKSKLQGIKLKKSIEKFKNRFLFSSNNLQNNPTSTKDIVDSEADNLSEKILKNIENAQFVSRSPTLNSAKNYDSNSSTTDLEVSVPSGYIPNLEDILNLDFHCRRIGIENYYLNEQNSVLNQELGLAQESLASLRKILISKLMHLDHLTSLLNSN
ncbi:hypothetical protein K502DRAFT_339182 [Neoconidiobolus thromboides FSU 785]|nr:hypothetical protein K502DRAFT_339182 [Neoconidiobolus thromboides FSU 785]